MLEFVKGDTWYFALVLRDSEYNGILLGEDDHAVFYIHSVKAKYPLIEKTIYAYDQISGRYVFCFDAETTDIFAPGTYYYDVKVYHGNDIYTVVKSQKFKVID